MSISLVMFDGLPPVRVFNAYGACQTDYRFVRLNPRSATIARIVDGRVETLTVDLGRLHYEPCPDCHDVVDPER